METLTGTAGANSSSSASQGWADPGQSAPEDRLQAGRIARLFEDQEERLPDAGRVRFPEEQSSRQELNVREDGPPGNAKGAGRVLLLEDDPSFRETIEDFLTESGYTVIAVQSGVEGILKVLAGDFSVVLCDMMMPALPGDMFYRAVERSCPHLCKRFVFMSGYREDARTNEFIKQVGGYLLRKPFPLQHLVDSIAFIDVLNTYHSVFEADSRAPEDSRVCPPADAPIASAALLQRPPARGPDTSEPVPPDPAPHRPMVAVPQRFRGLASLALTVARLAMLLCLIAFFASRYRQVRDRAAAGSADLLALEVKWKGASARLWAAEGKRRGIEAAVNRAKILVAESNSPGLAPILGSVATAATVHTDLWDIEARQDPEDLAALHLRVTGVCTGREPRSTADRFRQTLEMNLKQIFAKEGVTTRFELLEAAPPSLDEPTNPQNRQAAFTIIATTGRAERR